MRYDHTSCHERRSRSTAVAVVLALTWLTVGALHSLATEPEIECGLSGFAKQGRWFPVRLTNAEGIEQFDVLLMEKAWCSPRPTPLMRFRGARETRRNLSAVVSRFGANGPLWLTAGFHAVFLLLLLLPLYPSATKSRPIAGPSVPSAGS